MSQHVNSIMPSTDERMDIDTSFLDAYRTRGSDGLKKGRARALQANPGEPGKDPQPEAEPTPDEIAHEGAAALGGRSGYSGAAGTPAPVRGGVTAADGAVTEALQTHDDAQDVSAAAADETAGTDVLSSPVPLQPTDHQAPAQNDTAWRKVGPGGGDESAASLPQSGFRLMGVKSQPNIKSLPDSIISVLREQLRAAAVRELGVPDSEAREFVQRLSQGTLVTAFLLAQLDLRIDADPATVRAVELFRSRDPLLGSVVARLEALAAAGRSRDVVLLKLQKELAEVRRTSAVVEQAVAYSIADRTSNFLRGSHNLHDAPLAHKDALYVRDKAREATKKQQKLEREREGRPIR
ncbi:hypothetical protein ACFRAU_07525 [Arthrobacter sp. NPDC056691]|uniref:hypothetical protein n=1 Tax=Arthrobacter sp. NPDC056691 TaxID=3345913 RepID=UPI00366AD8E9